MAAILACLASLAPAQNALAPRAGAKTPDIQEALGYFAHGQQTVRVIVMLNGSQAPEIVASIIAQPQGAAALRRQVRSLQDAALSQFQSAELQVGHRYENLPGFSADVTLDGYQQLVATPGVESVTLAREMNLHLAQGIPLIGGVPIRGSYNGAGIAVAVVDSGVDYTHPQLGSGNYPNNKVIGGFDFGDNDPDPRPIGVAHGTAVAGIIAGDPTTSGPADYTQTQTGSGGVAFSAKLYALKVTAGTGQSAKSDAVIAAWDWCITHKDYDKDNPILVINTSMGGGQYSDQITCANASPLMAAAARLATAYGITMVASAGNDGTTNSLALPACLSDVISVGAVYDDAIKDGPCPTQNTGPDVPTCYSNVAPFMDLLAPAEWATTLDIAGLGGYDDDPAYLNFTKSFGGTSAASAYAAGAVALLQSAAKTTKGNYLPVSTVRSLLTGKGDIIDIVRANHLPKPRINLGAAVANMPDLPPPPYLLPSVASQGFLYNGALYAPANFSNGYGVSTAFAMGYYYKTYQDAKARGLKPEDLAQNPQHWVSPYFLFTNGGSDFFFLTGEMLRGYGSPSVLQYPGYLINPTLDDLADAANHKIVDFAPFFYHRPVVNRSGKFQGGNWSNNVAALQKWLPDSSIKKDGDLLVLGIPVYDSFANYSPDPDEKDVRKILYDGPAAGETVKGFHAVCIVDYLGSVHAYKIINNWGDKWGVNPFTGTSSVNVQLFPRGYGWLSERFIQRFAVEAWTIRSAKSLSIAQAVTTRGRAQLTQTTDYNISYAGPGVLTWDIPASPTESIVLRIHEGGVDDTLSISRKRGVRVGDTIPIVRTDASLKKLYTEASITTLSVAARLATLVTRDCHVENIITTKSVGLIRMSGRPNSSWPEIASQHYQETYIRNLNVSLPDQGVAMKLYNRFYTAIQSNLDNTAAAAEKPAVMQLSGVVLKDLRLGAQSVKQIATVSKKYNDIKSDIPNFISYGAVEEPYVPVAQLAPANKISGKSLAARAGASKALAQNLAVPTSATDIRNDEGLVINDTITTVNGKLYKIQITPLFTNVFVDCVSLKANIGLNITLLDSFLNTSAPLAVSVRQGQQSSLECDVRDGGIFYLWVYPTTSVLPLSFTLTWDDKITPTPQKFDRLITASEIALISANAGNIAPSAIFSGDIRRMTGRGVMFTIPINMIPFDKKKINLPQPGDLNLGTLVSQGKSLSLSSVGGIVAADRIICGGEVASLSSRVSKYRVDHFDRNVKGDDAFTSTIWYHGGVVGYAPPPTSQIPPAYMRVISGVQEIPAVGAPSFDIKSITADIAIFGVFAARPQEVPDPSKLDVVVPAANINAMRTGLDTGAIKKQYQDVWWYRIQGTGYTGTPVKPVSGVVLFNLIPPAPEQ
ncbi:MAG: S8 family serine peptidase [Candidatus Sumerlaeota bacterium]|nr:S8 family serine peptidase [Candidatus Sumerlaeota bacterium]